jgi:hypothetical protein
MGQQSLQMNSQQVGTKLKVDESGITWQGTSDSSAVWYSESHLVKPKVIKTGREVRVLETISKGKLPITTVRRA